MKVIFALITVILFATRNVAQKPYASNKYIDKADLLRAKNLDSAIYHLKKGIDDYTSSRDTINIINTICSLSELYDNVLDYGKSYDGYWKALFLADKSNDDISKARIYQELGWLYNSYRRKKESLHYFNESLKIKKKLVADGKLNLDYLVSDYFAIVNCYRVNGDFPMTKVYLDSCQITLKRISPHKKSFYVEAEQAYYKTIVTEEYESSIELLNEAQEFFAENNPSYLTVVYYFLAETYRHKGNLDKSIGLYEKSLQFSDLYNRHLGYKEFNYEALSQLYYNIADYKKAFLYKGRAQNLKEKTFGRKSKNNQLLFEIKDKYRIQKAEENRLINKNRIEKLESQKRISLLQNILLASIILFTVLYSILLSRNLRRKHRLEKENLMEKRRLERLKTQEVMELKNKELTASALQLIEKEEFISNLKDSINKENDTNSIRNMLHSFQSSPGSNWKEFEARFTSINQGFYDRIRKRFPDLGQTELKLCALVKLGFSSKEMSSLLGITIESVHTSRHRLRKKLDLNRSENLTDFINRL